MARASRLAVRLFIGLAILWLLLLLYPVRTGFFRAAIVCGFVAVFACLAVTLWRHRIWRWVPIAIPTALALCLLLPGRSFDRAALRTAYAAQLRSYAGVRYVWGGENWLGVDCSGLLRAALIDAHFREALRTLNPTLARRAIWFWWHDAAARDIGAGSLTTRLGGDVRLQDAPPGLLQPGDLAVTADGSHALAYVGDAHWIEADPYTLRVLELAPGVDSSWWRMKVLLCRWHCLEPQKATP